MLVENNMDGIDQTEYDMRRSLYDKQSLDGNQLDQNDFNGQTNMS